MHSVPSWLLSSSSLSDHVLFFFYSFYHIQCKHSALPSHVITGVLLNEWTSHFHLTIIRSFLSNLVTSSTFVAQVSLAYPKTLWIPVYFSWHFERSSLDVSTGASYLNFAQVQRRLLLLLILFLLLHLYHLQSWIHAESSSFWLGDCSAR